MLADPAFNHVYLDISWDEVAKYIVSSPEATKITTDLLNRFPDRFLFGTDAVAPANEAAYRKCYERYEPLWKALEAETSRKVRLANYEKIFDRARQRVRAWEKAHLQKAA